MITILGKYFMFITFQLVRLGVQSLVLSIPVYYLYIWNLYNIIPLNIDILQIFSIITIVRILLKFDLFDIKISTAKLSKEELEEIIKENE